MNTPSGSHTPLVVYAAVGLVAFALLFVEVELTRVFSVMIWYHFAFFVISTVLLGFSAAGVWLALSGWWRRLEPMRFLSGTALIFSLGVVGSFWCVTNLPFVQYVPIAGKHSVLTDLMWAGSLAAVLSPPFFFAGVCLCAALALIKGKTAGLYGSIMVGSGVGAVAAVYVLGPLSGPQAILVSPIAAAVAAALFSLLGQERRAATGASRGGGKAWLRSAPWLALIIVLVVLLGRADRVFPVRSAKMYPRIPEQLVIKRTWSSLACVDFFPSPPQLGLWGLSKEWTGTLPKVIGVLIDRWAITSIWNFDGNPKAEALDFLTYLPGFLAYQVLSEPNVLAIGTGGGIDVLAALHFDARSVTAVEINPDIVKTVREDFGEFSGRIYDHPRVQVVVGEGRNFLETTDQIYDLIQLDGVDTFAATQAGAFSLSENYLYTIEAFDSYLKHLTEKGILTLTRWVDRGQTLRLFATAVESLQHVGIPDASRNLMLFMSDNFSVILVRKSPFSAAEVAKVTGLARDRGFSLLYFPGVTEDTEYRQYLNAEDRSAVRQAHAFLVDPTTDDSPFFFEQNRLGNMFSQPYLALGALGGQGILLVLLAEFGLLSAVFLIAPLVFRSREADGQVGGLHLLLFFFAVGLGYITVEIALIQKLVLLLGHPVYALSVVLSVLLFCSGLGSMAGPAIIRPPRARAIVASLVVAVLAALYALVLQDLVAGLLGSPAAIRFGAALVLTAAIGFVMGLPFPSGLEMAEDQSSRAVAWGWAVNGCASVGGSILAMIAALGNGFTAVLTVGALAYALAAVAAVEQR